MVLTAIWPRAALGIAVVLGVYVIALTGYVIDDAGTGHVTAARIASHAPAVVGLVLVALVYFDRARGRGPAFETRIWRAGRRVACRSQSWTATWPRASRQSLRCMTQQRRTRAWGPVVLCGGAAAGLVGLAIYCAASGSQRYVETGDTYPGLFSNFLATAGYFLAALCGACVVGGRVYVLMGARPDAAGNIDAGVYRAHLLVQRAAVAWAVIAAVMVAVAAADGSGVGIGRLLGSGAIWDVITALEQPRAWIVVVLCAALAAIPSLRWLGQCVLLFPALIGVVAVPVVGNAGQGPNHDYGTSCVMVFWVVIAVWLGIKASWVNSIGRPGEVAAVRSDPVFRQRLAPAAGGMWCVGVGLWRRSARASVAPAVRVHYRIRTTGHCGHDPRRFVVGRRRVDVGTSAT